MAARLAYYDRNPTEVTIIGQAIGAAPHADTQRSTYTVPTARKALLGIGSVYVRRITVAAPVGAVIARVLTAAIGTLQCQLSSNTVDANVALPGENGNVLLAAVQIQLRDQDSSTGGTVDYSENQPMTEFDA